MKLLIKFPTRGRVNKFFEVLDQYYYSLDQAQPFEFVISCDTTDETMNNEEVKNKLSSYDHLTVYYSDNKNKIEAVNANLENHSDFDILLLASDDMIPQVKKYDNVIREQMLKNFPDTDGVLWFYDGHRKDLNTLSIIGKKYYDRFNYIYHPSYKSLWVDNEFTEVGNQLNRQVFIDKCIIRHNHHIFGETQYDQIYHVNAGYDSVDQKNFEARKKNNFDLK